MWGLCFFFSPQVWFQLSTNWLQLQGPYPSMLLGGTVVCSRRLGFSHPGPASALASHFKGLPKSRPPHTQSQTPPPPQ